MAREKIRTSRQGQMKIAQYIEAFVKYIPKVDLPEDQLCQYFQGGINDQLWGMTETLDLPRNNLSALMQIFERSEFNWVARQLSEAQRKEQLHQASYKNNNPSSKYTSPYLSNTQRENTGNTRYKGFVKKPRFPHKTNIIQTSTPNPPSQTTQPPKAGPSGTSANVD
jgi:hypothetical protein